MPTDLSGQLLDIALAAAAAAVELVHDHRPEELEVGDKSSATDHVTQMDRAAEELIRDAIGRSRPNDTVIGEEFDATEGSSGVTWWLDPIDGTTNYVYDHPGYAVSIGASVDGVRTVGVVADPTHARTYWATRGGGAFCDGRRLVLPAEARPLESMLVATGFGYSPQRRAVQGRVVAELVPRIRDIRRMGAAAVDLCSVAAGRVDAYYESGLSDWDLAAGVLIAAEAGAEVGSLEGGEVRAGSVLVAHPHRFEEFRRLLADLGAAGL